MTEISGSEVAPPGSRDEGWQLREQVRPLVIGLSIGHSIGTVGSLGFFAGLRSGRTGIVSTASVLWPKGARFGDRVHQPGRSENELLTARTRIAKLLRTGRPPLAAATAIDAAVAEILDGVKVAGNVLPAPAAEAGSPLGPPVDLAPDDLGEEVAFVGRTSGYSTGLISTIAIDNLSIERYTFDNCIEVRSPHGRFSRPGDGGALVYRRRDCAPIGLIFARFDVSGGDPSTFVMPLRPILQTLDVSFLSAV